MTKNDDLLRISGLVKAYKGRTVVNGVHMTVKPGEVVGLLGPNGAGKSTTFNMAVGLVSPDAGKIHFKNKEITHLPMYERARLGMGYLAQDPSIFRRLTVEQNVSAILETLKLTKKERQKRLESLLEELSLTHLADQKASTLSGGERRRLEITRALVTTPDLLMLDEPFSGVDPISVHEVQTIITELRDKGLAILITDHGVRETLAVCDRAYLISQGEILCEGTGDYLINNEQARKIYLGPRFVA
ncbi:MAG: LPS export ABC transporter ATP-binding protein [Lentisphaeria bacterium]|nr:LPS export ABC transporter ATP-binding protein [Lentisphaeria bacterium]